MASPKSPRVLAAEFHLEADRWSMAHALSPRHSGKGTLMVCGNTVLTSHWSGRATRQAFVPCGYRWRVARRSPLASAMTSDVKGCQPIFLGLHAFFLLGASEKTEPAICDGCSCCYPWVGSHLTCRRRVPASLSARVSWTSLSTLPRVTPHRGGAFSDARWNLSELHGFQGAVSSQAAVV
jgi:hypothetical protein